jgi:hypothetical protein
LIRAYRAHVAAGLEVIAINDPVQEHSSGDGTKHVRTFVDDLAVPFFVALDKRGRVRDTYGILTLPTTLFVDSAGVVQAVNRGPMSREELERGIASILPRGGLELKNP